MDQFSTLFDKIFFMFLITTFLWTDHITGKNQALAVLTETSTIVVELAIFCDVNCAKMFNGDTNKSTKFWAALVWNIHLKFQSMPKLNISFRVNSIVHVDPDVQQHLIEPLRLADNTLPGKELLSKYEGWLYEKAAKEGSTGYDIAVVAVGSKLNDNIAGLSSGGGGCLIDVYNRKIISVVLTTMHDNGLGHILSRQIAYLLHARTDTKEEYEKHNCGKFNADRHRFIMALNGGHQTQQHLFSPCSQKQISKFLTSHESSCFKTVHTEINPILDTSRQCDVLQNGKPITFQEQCQLLVGGNSVKLTKAESECVNLFCYLNLELGMYSPPTVFQPMSGTKCFDKNIKGTCHMGKCIPDGGFLLHTGSKLCLENNEPFSIFTNSTNLYNCLYGRSSTPLDFVKIEAASSSWVYIKFLGLSTRDYNFEEKCLALDKSNQLIFEKCKFKKASYMWQQIYALHTEKFLLKHVATKRCLIVDNTTGVTQLTTVFPCSVADGMQLWRFVDEQKLMELSRCELHQTLSITETIISYFARCCENLEYMFAQAVVAVITVLLCIYEIMEPEVW